MACCSCFKQARGDRLHLQEARLAVPWLRACRAPTLSPLLGLLPCPRTSALGLLRGPVVCLVADWQCPFARVCTECFSPAPTSPIAPGQQPPTSSSTLAHTRCLPFSRAVRRRRKTIPRNNRITENHFFQKTVTRAYTRVARGKRQPPNAPPKPCTGNMKKPGVW